MQKKQKRNVQSEKKAKIFFVQNFKFVVVPTENDSRHLNEVENSDRAHGTRMKPPCFSQTPGGK